MKKCSAKIICALGVLIFIVNLPFNWVLCSNASFEGYFQVLNDIKNQIPYESIVLVENDQETINTFVNNLRVSNNNLVYSFADLEDITRYYPDKDIYVLSRTSLPLPDKLIFEKNYDIGTSMSNVGGYPLSVSQDHKTYYVYLVSALNDE